MSVEAVIMVSVPVSDQGRALAFYAGTLGLELTRADETMFGGRRVHVAAGGATSLSLVTWHESMPPGSLRGLVLRSSDVQADYERLEAAGVVFDGPPWAVPGGAWEAVCYDPDGNALVLHGEDITPDGKGRAGHGQRRRIRGDRHPAVPYRHPASRGG
jgi:predicted enzyme related to lactoylglutathione lyase